MRVLVKGGVWKNSEDEILKAGIMKYGKNQWARVATLLPRKTARQCKRRWYEWLDPMIKKTDWTREEDEKLLHLAKLMPTQWRTIAPMVGRTAGQCLERYSQLLDGITTSNDDKEEETAFEVDVNPEGKPARPDPVDMDEDEKEMLSEAKARLANTKGKKAKRQAREKLLESAKRIAKLQKYRELKAAGVGGRIPKHFLEGRNRKDKAGIDYASGEIPFERQVPSGFYDTSEETLEGNILASSGASKSKLMKQANADPDERAKADRESMKRDRERFEKLAKQNLAAALQEVDKRNSATSGNNLKRQKLNLPEPMISDIELAQVSSVIVRTPLAPDIVQEEARNQKLRISAPTPLSGGDAIPITKPQVVNRSVATGASVMSTSFRDSFQINEDSIPTEANAIEEEKVKLSFDKLPAPKYNYEIQVPIVIDKDDEDSHDVIPDAADERKLLRQKQQAEYEEKMQRRTEVTKRGLPIPVSVPSIDSDWSLIDEAFIGLVAQDVNGIEYPRNLSYLRKADKLIKQVGTNDVPIEHDKASMITDNESRIKRLKKLEKKTEKFVLGLKFRAEKAIDEFKDLQKEIGTCTINLATYKYMQSKEQINCADLEDELMKLSKIENDLQNRMYELTS